MQCPLCGAEGSVDHNVIHRSNCPNDNKPFDKWVSEEPRAPIQQRMLRLWIHGSAAEGTGMQVDVPMPADFNLAMWWQAVKANGMFLTLTLDFVVPFERIMCACTFVIGGPEPAKVMPFKAIDGGKTP